MGYYNMLILFYIYTDILSALLNNPNNCQDSYKKGFDKIGEILDYCETFSIRTVSGNLGGGIPGILKLSRRAAIICLLEWQPYVLYNIVRTKPITMTTSSVYAFSIENFKRSEEEREELFDLMNEKLGYLIKEVSSATGSTILVGIGVHHY